MKKQNKQTRLLTILHSTASKSKSNTIVHKGLEGLSLDAEAEAPKVALRADKATRSNEHGGKK